MVNKNKHLKKTSTINKRYKNIRIRIVNIKVLATIKQKEQGFERNICMQRLKKILHETKVEANANRTKFSVNAML